MNHDSVPNTVTPEGYLINRFTDKPEEFSAFKELVAKTLQNWWLTYSEYQDAIDTSGFTLDQNGFENMNVIIINAGVHFSYQLNPDEVFVISINRKIFEAPVVSVYVAFNEWYKKWFTQAGVRFTTYGTTKCIDKTLPTQPCIMVNSFLKVAHKVEKALGIAFVNKVAETTSNDSTRATLAETSTTFTNLRNRYAALSNNANPPIDIQALVSKLTPAEAAFLFKLIDKVPE